MILILGRFQPFHNGHLKVLKDAYAEDKNVVVAIGSACMSHEPENPFTSDERIKMLKAVFKEEKMDIKTYKVPNIPCDSHYVEHVAKHVGGMPKKVITENPWTVELFEKKGIEVVVTERYFGISATEIRKKMMRGDEWKKDVPAVVVKIIEKIGGVERIKSLN